MKFKYKILLTVPPAVLVLDQLTKIAVFSWVEFGSRYPVIDGFFDLVHFRNTGAAFGLLSGMPDGFRVPFFYIVAAIAAVLLALFYRSINDRDVLMSVALSLVFGGIAGNILDRIRLGSVVDFLSFHLDGRVWEFSFLGRAFSVPLEWPAFNVADSAITVAMFLLAYVAIFRSKEE